MRSCSTCFLSVVTHRLLHDTIRRTVEDLVVRVLFADFVGRTRRFSVDQYSTGEGSPPGIEALVSFAMIPVDSL